MHFKESKSNFRINKTRITNCFVKLKYWEGWFFISTWKTLGKYPGNSLKINKVCRVKKSKFWKRKTMDCLGEKFGCYVENWWEMLCK